MFSTGVAILQLQVLGIKMLKIVQKLLSRTDATRGLAR